MKKKLLTLILEIILLIIIFVLIKYFNNSKKENENHKTGTAEYLFDLKVPYIGDNSSVGKLLNALDIWSYGDYTFSLITSDRPYTLTINYSSLQESQNKQEINIFNDIEEKSIFLLALIDNVDQIEWIFSKNMKYTITLDDLNGRYGNIKDYGKSVKSFNKLLSKLGYNENITMSIKELTNEGITLVIKNGTNKSYYYGGDFIVKRKENDEWVNVEGVKNSSNLIAYILRRNSSVEETCNFGISLLPGQYKLTKEFEYRAERKKYIISVEFEIK